jgi:hypothetical protein
MIVYLNKYALDFFDVLKDGSKWGVMERILKEK